MSLFLPGYKRYAAWPVVIWCRLMRHHNQPSSSLTATAGEPTNAMEMQPVPSVGR